MSGQAGANKAVFKADLLICLGTPSILILPQLLLMLPKKDFVNIDKNQLSNLN